MLATAISRNPAATCSGVGADLAGPDAGAGPASGPAAPFGLAPASPVDCPVPVATPIWRARDVNFSRTIAAATGLLPPAPNPAGEYSGCDRRSMRVASVTVGGPARR